MPKSDAEYQQEARDLGEKVGLNPYVSPILLVVAALDRFTAVMERIEVKLDA